MDQNKKYQENDSIKENLTPRSNISKTEKKSRNELLINKSDDDKSANYEAISKEVIVTKDSEPNLLEFITNSNDSKDNINSLENNEKSMVYDSLIPRNLNEHNKLSGNCNLKLNRALCYLEKKYQDKEMKMLELLLDLSNSGNNEEKVSDLLLLDNKEIVDNGNIKLNSLLISSILNIKSRILNNINNDIDYTNDNIDCKYRFNRNNDNLASNINCNEGSIVNSNYLVQDFDELSNIIKDADNKISCKLINQYVNELKDKTEEYFEKLSKISASGLNSKQDNLSDNRDNVFSNANQLYSILNNDNHNHNDDANQLWSNRLNSFMNKFLDRFKDKCKEIINMTSNLKECKLLNEKNNKSGINHSNNNIINTSTNNALNDILQQYTIRANKIQEEIHCKSLYNYLEFNNNVNNNIDFVKKKSQNNSNTINNSEIFSNHIINKNNNCNNNINISWIRENSNNNKFEAITNNKLVNKSFSSHKENNIHNSNNSKLSKYSLKDKNKVRKNLKKSANRDKQFDIMPEQSNFFDFNIIKKVKYYFFIYLINEVNKLTQKAMTEYLKFPSPITQNVSIFQNKNYLQLPISKLFTNKLIKPEWNSLVNENKNIIDKISSMPELKDDYISVLEKKCYLHYLDYLNSENYITDVSNIILDKDVKYGRLFHKHALGYLFKFCTIIDIKEISDDNIKQFSLKLNEIFTTKGLSNDYINEKIEKLLYSRNSFLRIPSNGGSNNQKSKDSYNNDLLLDENNNDCMDNDQNKINRYINYTKFEYIIIPAKPFYERKKKGKRSYTRNMYKSNFNVESNTNKRENENEYNNNERNNNSKDPNYTNRSSNDILGKDKETNTRFFNQFQVKHLNRNNKTSFSGTKQIFKVYKQK